MELRIENESTTQDIQTQFNALYPFLQLQFFQLTRTEKKDVQKLVKATPGQAVRKLWPMIIPIKISVENNVTVDQLLQNFKQMGVLVQVYRKSANQCVETSLTDDWTLERQNREAMLVSMPIEKLIK